MNIEEIKKAAADFVVGDEIKALKHYDTVQNALLKRAAELELKWPETRQFSAEVHRLKFEVKPE